MFTVLSPADGLAGGVRVNRADGTYLIFNADDGGASARGIVQVGDGGTYRQLDLNPYGGNVYINGTAIHGSPATFDAGSIAAPGVAFNDSPGSGLSLGPGFAYVQMSHAEHLSCRFHASASARSVVLPEGAFGAGAIGGATVSIGRNSSGGGAPGMLQLAMKNGSIGYIWVDSTGLFRGDTNPATEASGDTPGSSVIIGMQTSQRATKDITRQVTDTSAALDLITRTPVYEFTYKSGAYSNHVFVGITTDDSPAFGMDEGRVFNPVSAFGHTVLALQEIARRLDALEAGR